MMARCKLNPCCGATMPGECTPPPQIKPNEGWDAYEQRTAKPASEPAGGDVRETIARIIDPHSFVPYEPTGAADDAVFADMVKSSLDDAYRKADRILAALSQSTSAGRVGE